MEENSSYKFYCPKCKHKTWHEIIFKHIKPEYYNQEYDLEDKSYYYIVKCFECDDVLFVKEKISFDGVEPVDKSFEIYPKLSCDIQEIKSSLLPPEINKIYNETIIALNNNLDILSAVGLRAIIEGFCTNINIKEKIVKDSEKESAKGENINCKNVKLSQCLEYLKNENIISNNEYELLNTIKKFGNEAIHNINPMSRTDQITALKIINNLLENFYCLNINSKENKQ